jgi:hypothetical protein
MIEDPSINAFRKFRGTQGDCCTAIKLDRNAVSLVTIMIWVICRSNADVAPTRHIH